jgi:predicted phosphodiesterase
MLQTIPSLIALKGNHDSIFLKIIEGDKDLRKNYLKKYGRSMENLLRENNNDIIQWLYSLPESYISSELDLSCYHGSPWDAMECYVYPDSSLDKFLDYHFSSFVLGHTHYRMYRKIGQKIIINPGSLGQPRDGGWPTYTVMDCTLKKNIIREVPYDKSGLLKKIDAIGDDNPYLKRFLGK